MAILLFQERSIDAILDVYMLDILVSLENAINRLTNLYVNDAIILCGIMMLFYLSVQAYTLMTGDGKVSLLPLLRPFIFFLIVANWSMFLNLISYPLKQIDYKAKRSFTDVRANINDKYGLRLDLQEKVYEVIFTETQSFQELEDNRNWWQKLGDITEDVRNRMEAALARGALVLQNRIMLMFERAMETLVVIIFKGCIYVLYYIRIFILAILRMIGPFIFALSVIGAYRDLYLQWISKFVAVSLYSAFAHVAIMLAFILVSVGLDTDIAFLRETLALHDPADPQTGATILNMSLRPNGGGMGLIMCAVTGIFGLISVPLISTWILGANSTTALGNKAVSGVTAAVKAGAGKLG